LCIHLKAIAKLAIKNVYPKEKKLGGGGGEIIEDITFSCE